MQMFEEKDVKRQVRNCNYSMDETNLSSNEELHIQELFQTTANFKIYFTLKTKRVNRKKVHLDKKSAVSKKSIILI